MIVGVVLAAGASRRLGQPKQLLPFHGRPLLEATLRRVRRAHLDGWIVVLGASAERIQAEVNLGDATVVVNPDFALGQSTSLRAGLAAVPSAAAAVVFLLGDQPLQDPAAIDALVAGFRATNAPIVAPSYDGVRGNPVLFSRALFAELAAVDGDQGARPLLRTHAGLIHEVPVPAGLAPPADVDTWEDYQALLAGDAGRDA